ncbi:hypothetical protein [Frankia sp. QA3]|uniref:hypothetical protein n=1 Tax=Frankia sp. QA3 TaxID=710111 RepID=UPI0018DEE0C6|nr:hypothetical protein [Frankia sp. QA3]
MAHRQASRGLREALVAAYALTSEKLTAEVDEWHARIDAAAKPLFTRAREHASTRPRPRRASLRWNEVLALVTAIAGAAGPDRQAARRMLTVVVVGLGAPEPAAHRSACSPPA